MKRRLTILGSTGSIGLQALDVVRSHRERFEIVGLCANKDAETLKEQAEEFELYSLHPGQSLDNNLGKVSVSDASVRRELLSALYRGIATSKGGLACAQTRHGIRAESRGVTAELFFSFECRIFGVRLSTGKVFSGSISESPEGVFNHVLSSAHVPLSPRG